MQQQQSQQEEFSQRAIRAQRLRLFFGGVPFWLGGLLLLGLALTQGFDYLARLPRERNARNADYLERISIGFKQAKRAVYLSLLSPENDAKASQLPLAELYVRGDHLDALSADLPPSNDFSVPAQVKLGGKEYGARVRFRGDSINHWAYPSRSWRVRLTGGRYFRGAQSLNLVLPRTVTQVENWFGYQIANFWPDLLVPESEFVHFRLNRNYDGIRLLLEQTNQDFLTKRGLAPGKIYSDAFGTTDVYGSGPRKRLYHDKRAWQINALEPNPDRREIVELIRVVNEVQDSYLFYQAIADLAEVEQIWQYMAMLELVGSVHADQTHNAKYYFDPISGKFRPIVWDTVAYLWKNKRPLDIVANSLFKWFLLIPQLREGKDRELWRAVNGDLSTERLQQVLLAEVERLRADVHSFPLKLHATASGVRHISNQEWEDSIKELLEIIEARNDMIRKSLETSTAQYRLEQVASNKARLLIRVDSRTGVRLEQVTLRLSAAENPILVQLKRQELERLPWPVRPEQETVKKLVELGSVSFAPNDSLYSKRGFDRRGRAKVVPSVYSYELLFEREIEQLALEGIRGVSLVSASEVQFAHDPELELPATARERFVWWEPQRFRQTQRQLWRGQVDLNQTVVLRSHESLLIEPGTRIKLGAGVSIVVDGGQLIAQGQADNPISFEPSTAEPWGAIAFNNGARGVFSNVNISGGSEAYHRLVRYDGFISAHDSDLVINDAKLAGGYISARRATVELERVNYCNLFRQAVFADRSNVSSRELQLDCQVGRSRSESAQLWGSSEELVSSRSFGVQQRSFEEVPLDQFFRGVLNSAAVLAQSHESQSDLGVDRIEIAKDLNEGGGLELYFDSGEALLRSDRLYRLRQGYRNRRVIDRHFNDRSLVGSWPERLLIEYRETKGRRGSAVSERKDLFEFSQVQAPFGENHPAPAAPWPLFEFIEYAKAGHFKNMTLLPSQQALLAVGSNASEQELSVTAVATVEHFRARLKLFTLDKSTGADKSLDFFVTISKREVLPVSRALKVIQVPHNDKPAPAKLPKPLAEFSQVTIEPAPGLQTRGAASGDNSDYMEFVEQLISQACSDHPYCRTTKQAGSPYVLAHSALAR